MMAALFGLLAAGSLVSASAGLTGDIQAAIWNDLQLNAIIGNGTWIASLWYNASAGNADKPDLHISDLQCRRIGAKYHCAFKLVRDGGVATVLGEEAPDKLTCDAMFVHSPNEAWSVDHLPPPQHRGHSLTTMHCKRTSQR